jgi:group I intron endonuclease
MKTCIYKITNPKNKVYIGQTINVENRLKTYEKGLHFKGQIRLYNSYKKYGWSSHIFEILENCDESKLNERERYWQDYYNVLGKEGLNCKLTQTSSKSGQLSEETKNRIGNANRGRVGHFNGKNHTPESIEKMKKPKPEGFNKGRKITWNNRPNPTKVIQRDKEGNFVKLWDSVKQIKEILNINVYDAVEKKNNTAGGFIWDWDK